MLHLTIRKHKKGSGKWINSRWVYRIVDAPAEAKTLDKRSKGVKILWESPLLATYWSHGKAIPTAMTRQYDLDTEILLFCARNDINYQDIKKGEKA